MQTTLIIYGTLNDISNEVSNGVYNASIVSIERIKKDFLKLIIRY